MDYLEFIARVTSHIPDKGQVMIRYYGLYHSDKQIDEFISLARGEFSQANGAIERFKTTL